MFQVYIVFNKVMSLQSKINALYFSFIFLFCTHLFITRRIANPPDVIMGVAHPYGSRHNLNSHGHDNKNKSHYSSRKRNSNHDVNFERNIFHKAGNQLTESAVLLQSQSPYDSDKDNNDEAIMMHRYPGYDEQLALSSQNVHNTANVADVLNTNRNSRPLSIGGSSQRYNKNTPAFKSMFNITEEEDLPPHENRNVRFSSRLTQSQYNLNGHVSNPSRGKRPPPPPPPVRSPSTQLSRPDLTRLEPEHRTNTERITVSFDPHNGYNATAIGLVQSEQRERLHDTRQIHFEHSDSNYSNGNNGGISPSRYNGMNPIIPHDGRQAKSNRPLVAYKVAPYTDAELTLTPFSSTPAKDFRHQTELYPVFDTHSQANIEHRVPPHSRIAYHITPYRDIEKMQEHAPVQRERSTDSDEYQIPRSLTSNLQNFLNEQPPVQIQSARSPYRRQSVTFNDGKLNVLREESVGADGVQSPSLESRPPPLPSQPPPSRPPVRYRKQSERSLNNHSNSRNNVLSSSYSYNKYLAQSMFDLDTSPQGYNDPNRDYDHYGFHPQYPVSNMMDRRQMPLSTAHSTDDLLSNHHFGPAKSLKPSHI